MAGWISNIAANLDPHWRRSGASAVLLLVAGCTSLAPLPEPLPEPPLERAAPPPVLLLLGERRPSLEAVHDELLTRFGPGDVDTVSLSGARSLPDATRALLDRGGYRAAVAVGYAAGEALIGVGPERRVFCQVFDYRALAADGMAGVALLPAAERSLAAWKRLSPQLQTIGMLTGPDLDALVADVAAAASALELELIHREVTSDQAYYRAFRALSRRIDGLLLIPDHRVLSPPIIRALFPYAAKRSVEVMAYTPSLLELGAVAASVGEPRDVADRVMRLLEDPALYRATRGKVLPLTLARIETRQPARPPAAAASRTRHAQVD